MRNIASKVISIALALIMVFGALSISAFAVPNPEGDRVNIKYEVAKATSMPDDSGGTVEFTSDDVYAVTVYAKCQYGITYLQVPVHFDKTKFAPVMWADEDPANNGAYGYDGYYTENEDPSVYYKYVGDAWDDTSMYKSDFTSPASNKAQARYVGLGNKNAESAEIQFEFVAAEDPRYAAWLQDTMKRETLLDGSQVGITFLCLDDLMLSKNAYLNAYEAKVNPDWVRMATVYFVRLPGVSEKDVQGSVFGMYNDNSFGTQILVDVSGKPSYWANDYNQGTLQDGWQDLTYVSNATVNDLAVTSGPKVEREKGQIKMTATGDGTVADEFQFRVLSKISDADWNAYLANTGASEENNCLTKLGFVAYQGTEDFDMNQAKAAAKAGETQGDYYVATTDYVKHDEGTDAEFAARIDTTKGTCADATYIAFIQYKDAAGTEQYAFYDAEYQAQLKTNYDSLVSQYLNAFPYVAG